MNLVFSLVAVLALTLLAYLGVETAGLRLLFGVVVPYAAVVLFVGGVVLRVIRWGKVPVPFCITTTCGQQKSLPWIKSNNLENPHNTLGVLGRMALEVLFFRSLFRNTSTQLEQGKGGKRLVYGSAKLLWAGGLAFHYMFLMVVLRHLRFFSEPVPRFATFLAEVDGFFQIGAPVVYVSTLAFLGAVLFLLGRRLVVPQVRYISLLSDYFPLLLILGIGTTGVLLRHVAKTDIVSVKELTMGIVTASPVAPDNIHWLFFAHVLLVSVLFAYFPFSKLMHMAGVLMSPTRNLQGNSREVRHVNPWNYPVKVHTYEEYEDEFRDKMKAAGLPVERG